MANAFKIRKNLCKPQTGFDKDYVNTQVVEYVEKIGDADTDFVLKKRLIKNKKDIRKTIQASASDVGVENIMKKVALTGDMSIIPPVKPGIEDATKLPDNLADAYRVAGNTKALYNSLDDELKKGRSFEEFMKSFKAEDFIAFLKSKQVKDDKKQVVESEDDK